MAAPPPCGEVRLPGITEGVAAPPPWGIAALPGITEGVTTPPPRGEAALPLLVGKQRFQDLHSIGTKLRYSGDNLPEKLYQLSMQTRYSN